MQKLFCGFEHDIARIKLCVISHFEALGNLFGFLQMLNKVRIIDVVVKIMKYYAVFP